MAAKPQLVPIDELLNAEFRFLIDEAGFTVLEAGKNEVQLASGDFRISLRNDARDKCFGGAIWHEAAPKRMLPLVDYFDFFDGQRTLSVRDLPPARRQAEKLKQYLQRILRLLHAPPDDPERTAMHEFFTRW